MTCVLDAAVGRGVFVPWKCRLKCAQRVALVLAPLFQMPVMKLPGLKNLQRIYFAFGEPIRTDHYLGNWESDENCAAVKQATQAAVEDGIAFLQQLQQADPERLTVNRSPWLKALSQLFSSLDADISRQLGGSEE